MCIYIQQLQSQLLLVKPMLRAKLNSLSQWCLVSIQPNIKTVAANPGQQGQPVCLFSNYPCSYSFWLAELTWFRKPEAVNAEIGEIKQIVNSGTP